MAVPLHAVCTEFFSGHASSHSESSGCENSFGYKTTKAMNTATTILVTAIPCFILLIIAEAALDRHISQHDKPAHLRRRKDIITSFTVGSVGFTVNMLLHGGIMLVYAFCYQYRLFDLDASAWWVWLLAFFADDLSYYWYHRCSHEIRFLWASHVVHHSSQQYNLATGVRVPWTSHFSGVFLFWAWMPLIGFTPAMVGLFKAISIIYQFWLHTEHIKKLPAWFEKIFNTPSHHRVHHSSNVEYLDKNHGGILIIWDKLFGTFQQERTVPVYGLTKNIKDNDPITIAFHEWRNMFIDIIRSRTTGQAVGHLLKAPGWSPDGAGTTTRQLRSRSNQTTKYI